MATIIQIADAVVAQLNAATFSQPLTAARLYAPSFELPDMETLHVTVVPRGVASTSLDRKRDSFSFDIDLAVQKKTDMEQASLDALMTLSIGVVTNQSQRFIHTAQVSELAAEMKSYAKTLPGSKYVVDRRHGLPLGVAAVGSAHATARRPPEEIGEDERPTSSGARPAPV